MLKLTSLLLLVSLALAIAEPRTQASQGVLARNRGMVSPNHPYLFLSVPRARSGAAQGFEVIDEDEDDDDNALDDDEDSMSLDDDYDDGEIVPRRRASSFVDDDEADSDEEGMLDDNMNDDGEQEEDENPLIVTNKPNIQLIMKNAQPTHMMVPRDQAGAIMVPDGVIEIEGQSIIDEKTGKAALLVPRAALDAIPDGSVVALMERSLDESEEERANRVFVRRRRKGSRRNVRRRSGGGRRRRRGGKRRRRGGKKRPVRVYNTGGKKRRRTGVRGGSRPTVIQG